MSATRYTIIIIQKVVIIVVEMLVIQLAFSVKITVTANHARPIKRHDVLICLHNTWHSLVIILYWVHMQLHVKATPTGLSLSFSSDCPHLLIQESLENFLRSTQSLPLLLQGVCFTEKTMGILVDFVKRIPAVTVSAMAPSQIQLDYDHSLYPYWSVCTFMILCVYGHESSP